MYQCEKKNKAGKNTLFKCLVKKREKKPVSLRQFWERRNKVLVRRRVGGLGDIIMHRMIFEDFHRIMPEIELTFCCPQEYLQIVKDHPFLHDCYDYLYSKNEDYGIVYDTTTRCRVYEASTGINCSVNRSDIWAGSCGVELQKHDMHLKVPTPYLLEARKLIGDKPSVLFVPFTNNGTEKNLFDNTVVDVVIGLQNRGFNVVVMHTDPPPLFQLLNCQSIVTADLMTWKSVIAAVDYVISIDTAAFHLAGGMKKPLIGIFSWTNGKVYGKHYDFMLVQKHKDCDPDWCGPCNNWQMCPKVPLHHPKPCVAETKANEIMNAFDLLVKNKSKPFAYSLPVIR